MASQKRTPKPNTKKPPARQAVGREHVQAKPIREVITHPAERIPARAAASANKLKGTTKGTTHIPGIVKGDSATIAVDAARNLLGIQTRVGGTKGTPRPIDRSLAIKKAWATRKKLYGSSGQKDK